MRKTRSSHINQLRHVSGVAQKGEVGDKVLHWNLKRSAPCTPVFLWAKENLPPGWYTHRYGGGSWASSQGRLWPFLGKYGRCTDRYRGGSWTSPLGRMWPIVGLPWAPTKLYVHSRSTKCRVCGGKSVTRGALHPHKCKAFPHWRATVEQEHLHRWK